MVYCMCRLVNTNSNDRRMRNPTPYLRTGLGEWSNYADLSLGLFSVIEDISLKPKQKKKSCIAICLRSGYIMPRLYRCEYMT